MNTTEKKLINKIYNITKEIEDYIKSNNNWIFYFLNPLLIGTDANKQIFDTVHDYPTEWEDYISFNIVNIDGSSICINIHIDDGTEYGISLKRYIFLSNFEDTINRNMKIYNGKINELRIENIKKDIKQYKKYLADKEAELNKLLSDIKDYD